MAVGAICNIWEAVGESRAIASKHEPIQNCDNKADIFSSDYFNDFLSSSSTLCIKDGFSAGIIEPENSLASLLLVGTAKFPACDSLCATLRALEISADNPGKPICLFEDEEYDIDNDCEYQAPLSFFPTYD